MVTFETVKKELLKKGLIELTIYRKSGAVEVFKNVVDFKVKEGGALVVRALYVTASNKNHVIAYTRNPLGPFDEWDGNSIEIKGMGEKA